MNGEFSMEDMEQNKYKAGLGYFVFFLPLILCKDSKLGKHCANQGLLLMIASILVSVLIGIFSCIPLIGWIFTIVGRLARFGLFVVALLCFLQLISSERAVEIPYIGSFRLIN